MPTIKGNVFAVRACPPGCQCDYLTPAGVRSPQAGADTRPGAGEVRVLRRGV